MDVTTQRHNKIAYYCRTYTLITHWWHSQSHTSDRDHFYCLYSIFLSQRAQCGHANSQGSAFEDVWHLPLRVQLEFHWRCSCHFGQCSVVSQLHPVVFLLLLWCPYCSCGAQIARLPPQMFPGWSHLGVPFWRYDVTWKNLKGGFDRCYW